MQIGTSLYRYGDGSVTAKFHLVASQNKALTCDGSEFWNCVDVDSIDGWYETDAPAEEADE